MAYLRISEATAAGQAARVLCEQERVADPDGRFAQILIDGPLRHFSLAFLDEEEIVCLHVLDICARYAQVKKQEKALADCFRIPILENPGHG